MVTFAVGTGAFLAAIYNFGFWRSLTAAAHPASFFDALFLASVFALVVFLHATLLLAVPGRRPVQIAAAATLILASVIAYFIDNFGVAFTKSIVQSVFETDRQEATALVTWRLSLYLLFAGILPSFVVLLVRLPRIDRWTDFRQRLAFIGAATLTSAAVVFSLYTVQAPFWRSNKEILKKLNPDAALLATLQYVADRFTWVSSRPTAISNPGGPTRTLYGAPNRKPLLMFLNIGETARAQNFQLGGYARQTNPELSALEGVFYFSNASSCGTVTAVSVPCMFSHGGRRIFHAADAGAETNLLDAVVDGGFHVEWRENNTGGKGVPARVPTITYGPQSDPKLCENGTCYDEIMMSGLGDALRSRLHDTLIVFHQMGSHGPTYWKRYPAEFEKFKPACRTNELWRCTQDELINVYDNTIAYTDFVLGRQIRLLQALSDQFDSILIYVSDHGESLGERGLYLHGAPYFLAPKEQTHIPFLIWMSKGYRNRFAVNEDCLGSLRDHSVSHDNIYHTVLGALGLSNDVYRRELDLISRCAAALIYTQ
ncbi:MAG TPA: phosphoethanolamine--lipid A transferase [Xanthobacteraceae bacterium]|nr:phosphoethanolamine--lipid A transferase [Xanthobacteraceae bacterium]